MLRSPIPPIAALVVLSLSILFSALDAPPVAAQTFDDDFPVSGNQVLAMAKSGNTLYIGGNFSHVGPASGTGAVVDASTAAPPVSASGATQPPCSIGGGSVVTRMRYAPLAPE